MDMADAGLRICILSPDVYRQEMPARASIMEMFGRCLPSMGHKVEWLLPVEDIPGKDRTYEGATLHFVPRKPFQGLSFFGKYGNFKRYYREFQKTLENLSGDGTGKQLDVIIGRDDVHAGTIGLQEARRIGAIFAFMYSVPIERLWETRRAKRRFHHSIMDRMERKKLATIMEGADLIIPTSKWLGEELVREKVPKEKMLVVPMGVNPGTTSKKTDVDKLRSGLGLTEERVIMYLGDIDRIRGLKMLIDALAGVKASVPDAMLMMVGDGDGVPGLKEHAAHKGLEKDVIFTGRVPYADVPSYIALCDIGLATYPPTKMFSTASATKMMDYMAVGRPVVGNRGIFDVEEGLKESGGGVLVDFDAGSYAEGIIKLLNDRDEARRMGTAGREWVVRNRSYDIIARSLSDRFELLAGKGS